MSYRVIVTGTPSPRLVDVECHECLLLIEDVWRDEIPPACPRCGTKAMIEVWRSAPTIDFHDTKPIEADGVKFKSFRAMEKWEKRHNKTVMTANQWEQLPVDTNEERLARGDASRTEAIKKTHYKLKHGHMKPAQYVPESETLWDKPKIAEAK